MTGLLSGTGLQRALLAIAAAGVLLRLLHLFAVSATPIIGYHTTFHESDMYMFDQWAQRIVQGDVLGRQVYHPLAGWQLQAAPPERWRTWYGEAPVFYKAPFYPYLVAALYRLAGDAIVPLALLQILARRAVRPGRQPGAHQAAAARAPGRGSGDHRARCLLRCRRVRRGRGRALRRHRRQPAVHRRGPPALRRSGHQAVRGR